jgi:translation initiation factor 4G
MPAQPNGPPHMRRESSQSSNQGFQPNGGRGRGFQPQPYAQSPQPYRAMPNQQMGRGGMAPSFTPQGQMNSPYRNNRPSPAMAPAAIHQQQHFANPQGQPFYPGQQYPPQVRIPSHSPNNFVPEFGKAVPTSPATQFSTSTPEFRCAPVCSTNLTGPEFQAPDDESDVFLQPLDFSAFTKTQQEQFLTTMRQNMYGMPQPGLDPYNNYYGQPAYGLQQSMHYPGNPNSPGRSHGFPQQMQNPYAMPGPYGQPSQGQSMSRTPSQMSERPPSAVPQPSTPAMTNVSHHAHTPSVTSASPAPSSSAFQVPAKKKTNAIVIKTADGEIVDFKSKVAASPAPSTAAAAPAQSKSPAIAASSTPPPRAPSASDATKTEEAPAKSASEKKADFVKQFQEKLRLQGEAEKKAKEDADNEAKAAAEAEQKKKDDAKAAEEKAAQDAKDAQAKEAADAKAAQEAKEAEEKAAKEAKEKEEAAAAAKSTEDDEAEKKRKEDEDLEKMIAEMEAEEARREEQEKKYAEERARKKAEEDAKAGDKIKAQEEALRKAEAEAEAAEIARQNETPEQKAEREAKDKEMFASLKKNTMFGPGATGEEPSEDSAPPAAAPAPVAKPASATKPKPAALKLETNKPVEPAQPTAGMESLKTARFIQIRNEAINYPEGIQSPNPALNQGSKSKGRQYDKDFLLQFQEVFKEKPSIDWDSKLKETVGDGSDGGRTPSVRSAAGRAPSQRGIGGGMGNFGQGGAFGGGSRTLPPGTTSQQRFEQASGRGGTMTNPLAPFVQGGSQRGFPMAPGMSRSSSFQPGPNSPRVGSQGGRGDRSRRGGGGQGKGHQADAKTMPLTAGKDLKPLEQSQTGWKPHGAEKVVVTGHMAPDMVQRKVKAALNKMTPEKFDKISDQILEIAAQSKDETDGRTLRQVIQLTFEKACDEAHWSSMYAKFCFKMLNTMSHDIKDENVRDKQGNPVVGGALFRKYLLNRCQEEFERGWEVNLPEAPEEGKEATMLSDEYYIAAAAKRKGLGLIQFIGELYKLGMLTLRIMHECVLKLLDFEGLPDESAIESLVKLLRTVGATMESAEAGPKMINMYFERVEKVMNMEGLNSRLRFMLLDTIDIRKSGWQSKDILKGPKTIAEIHQEAVAAQQAAELERSRSQRGGGGGRLPMGRGDARSFSGGGMMPPPDNGGRVQMDDLRKLSKGASNRGLNNAGSLGPSMLGSRSGSGRRGLGPMMGRGGDDSGNSSRTGTPPVKEKTAHANAFE